MEEKRSIAHLIKIENFGLKRNPEDSFFWFIEQKFVENWKKKKTQSLLLGTCRFHLLRKTEKLFVDFLFLTLLLNRKMKSIAHAKSNGNESEKKKKKNGNPLRIFFKFELIVQSTDRTQTFCSKWEENRTIILTFEFPPRFNCCGCSVNSSLFNNFHLDSLSICFSSKSFALVVSLFLFASSWLFRQTQR